MHAPRPGSAVAVVVYVVDDVPGYSGYIPVTSVLTDWAMASERLDYELAQRIRVVYDAHAVREAARVIGRVVTKKIIGIRARRGIVGPVMRRHALDDAVAAALDIHGAPWLGPNRMRFG